MTAGEDGDTCDASTAVEDAGGVGDPCGLPSGDAAAACAPFRWLPLLGDVEPCVDVAAAAAAVDDGEDVVTGAPALGAAPTASAVAVDMALVISETPDGVSCDTSAAFESPLGPP